MDSKADETGERTRREIAKAVEIVIKCIRWILEARDEQWVGKKCIPCDKCDLADVKPHCVFNSARALMALCRAHYIWQCLQPNEVQETSDAITDAVTYLLDCAQEDQEFKPVETFYWWSSDMTLGEHRIEVVRSTAAVVLALIDFKRFTESAPKMSWDTLSKAELDRKIRGGVQWLRKAMICNNPTVKKDALLQTKIVPTAMRGVPGYQAFVYYGSWINIPIHIHNSVHQYARRVKRRLKGTKKEIEMTLESSLSNPTTNRHIEACRRTMNLECVKRLVKSNLPRAFDVECTKDGLMALAVYAKEYGEEIPEIQLAVECLRKKRDRNGLWSELICMNFHTLVALLLADVEPSDDFMGDALGYLNNFPLGEEPDICLLVSKTLVDFLMSNATKKNATRILKEHIDEIDNLKRRPSDLSVGAPAMYCYIFENECAIPQTAWAVYTLAIVLKPLKEYVESTVHELFVPKLGKHVPAPTLINQHRERKDILATELDKLYEKLTSKDQGYKPRSTHLAGIKFDVVYEKSHFARGSEIIVVQKLENLNELAVKEFTRTVKRVKDVIGDEFKKVIILVSTKCEKEIDDLFQKAEEDVGIQFEIIVAK